MNRNGFTIIELTVTIAVFAMLAAVTAPSLKSILMQQQVDGHISAVVSMIYRARSEAIKRNTVVTVCKSNDKVTCGGSWSEGWVMFEDGNADGVRSLNEAKLSQAELADGFEKTLSAFGSQSYVRFLQNGLTSFHNGTFKLCPSNGDVKLARAVIFSKTARARTSKDTTKDGIDEDASGNNLDCS